MYPDEVIVPLEANTDWVFTPGHGLGDVWDAQVALWKTRRGSRVRRGRRGRKPNQHQRRFTVLLLLTLPYLFGSLPAARGIRGPSSSTAAASSSLPRTSLDGHLHRDLAEGGKGQEWVSRGSSKRCSNRKQTLWLQTSKTSVQQKYRSREGGRNHCSDCTVCCLWASEWPQEDPANNMRSNHANHVFLASVLLFLDSVWPRFRPKPKNFQNNNNTNEEQDDLFLYKQNKAAMCLKWINQFCRGCLAYDPVPGNWSNKLWLAESLVQTEEFCWADWLNWPAGRRRTE